MNNRDKINILLDQLLIADNDHRFSIEVSNKAAYAGSNERECTVVEEKREALLNVREAVITDLLAMIEGGK